MRHPPLVLDETERRELLARLDREIERQQGLVAQAVPSADSVHLRDEHSVSPSLSPDWPVSVHPEGVKSQAVVSDIEVELILAEQLWRERHNLQRRTVHWMAGAVLLAVVDIAQWQVGLRRQMDRALLAEPVLVGRPEGAALMPDEFRQLSLFDLFWRFGQLSPAAPDILPKRFHSNLIVLRRMPTVSPVLLAQRHKRMLAMLQTRARTAGELAIALGSPVRELMHDLAALYFTRSVATEQPVESNWALRSFKGLIRPGYDSQPSV